MYLLVLRAAKAKIFVSNVKSRIDPLGPKIEFHFLMGKLVRLKEF